MPTSPKPFSEYSLIIFDKDNTLTPSKSPIEADVASLITKLIAQTKVAVISGGSYPNFTAQILNGLPHTTENYSNFFLMPASGTSLYVWKGTWVQEYAESFSKEEKEQVMTALNNALRAVGYTAPEKIYGEIIEDRGSQITFSALGQSAPLELKSAWDPDRSTRTKIIDILQAKIPGFDSRIGGTTSVDITRRGVNKAYGIRKLEEYLKLSPEKILFVGDALFVGGNDYPAKATGVDCVQVSGPGETKAMLSGWLTP